MNRDEFLARLDATIKEHGKSMRKCLKRGEVALYELKICRCWECPHFERECHPLEVP